MRDVDFIPETVTVSDAFDAMQEKRLSMMMVINEYGGMRGGNLKQLIGVIVGTMVDDDPPSEGADSSIVKLDDGSYLLDADDNYRDQRRLHDDGIALPEGEYHTVAGLVLFLQGEIPDEDDVVRTRELAITVTIWLARESTRCAWRRSGTPGAETA